MEKTIEGYPHLLMLFFLLLAWLFWFTLGLEKQNWNMAWILGFFFCGLAFYTQGFVVILYFLLPLIFMRRPLTVWQKLKKPGFFIGLIILLLFILSWYLPHLIYAPETKLRSFEFSFMSTFEYFWHCLLFPLDLFVRYLPWSIFAWAPFCVAFIAIDKTPIFSRFLRTIFFVLFFLLWFSPSSEPRDMLIILPPLALLTGLYYDTFKRRCGRFFPPFLKYFTLISLLTAMTVLAFFFLPPEWLELFVSISRGIAYRDILFYKLNAYLGICLIVFIALIFASFKKIPLWLAALCASIIGSVIMWNLVVPYKAQGKDKQNLGRDFANALSKEGLAKDELVYKSAIKGLYGECYYSGYRIKKIVSPKELPKDKEMIYLLSTQYPQVPTREWTNLLPKDMRYHGHIIFLWRGNLKKRQVKKWPVQ